MIGHFAVLSETASLTIWDEGVKKKNHIKAFFLGRALKGVIARIEICSLAISSFQQINFFSLT